MRKLVGDAIYVAEVSAQLLQDAVHSVIDTQPQAILVLASDQPSIDIDAFGTLLKASETPIFGGVFPHIVNQGKVLDSGMLVIPMYIPLEIKCYEQIQESKQSKLDFDFKQPDIDSLMVLVDGLARNIDAALNQIFDTFGQKMKVFGGGAGSLSFQSKPCLFAPSGMHQDAMIVVAMKQAWELAIGHGWDILDGPFIANKVDDNKIIELNFQPALSVYNQVIEESMGICITENNFFETCSSFPFGIERLDGDVLVRDPITLDDTALVCVGTVPENTMLYVLKGKNERLIQAAKGSIKALSISSENCHGLLFDCISRKMFLDHDFDKEIECITQVLAAKSQLIGALVLGEIASNDMGGIDLHNKTAVTALAKMNT